MKSLAGAILAACLGALAWFVRNDRADYAAFKRLTDSAERQRRYRAWGLKSFALFSGSTIVALAALGRLGNLFSLPLEFAPLAGSLQSLEPARAVGSSDFFIGLLGAVALGGAAGAFLSRRLGRRSAAPVLGDIEPLMPRNGAESAWVALLSVNAGVSEELFFRLLLPLLLTLVGAGATLACVLAAIVFGLVHAYQGWLGVAATTVLGFALTALYLGTGNLWIAVGVHASLDLFGLLVRPLIARPRAA